MAVDFYNQGDQEIHEGGQFYIPQERYRLGKFSNTVAPMPMDGTQQVTQEFGIPYTGAFTNAGGGGGLGLGGKFGNLDLSKTKTFNKNVFKTTGPVKGWDMSEITGYYDPTSHTYKTLENMNIEHGGHLTDDPKEGDIEGTPFQFPSMFAMLKKIREKITGPKINKNDVPVDMDKTTTDAGTTGEGGIDLNPSTDRDRGRSRKEGETEQIAGGHLFRSGGRAGFFEGALADTAEGQAMSPGTSATGEFRGGQGDKNNQGNTGGITQLNTDLISTEPSMEAMYSPSELATLRARLYNKNLLTEDDINLEGELSGGNSLIDYGINFTGDGITGSNVGIGPVNVDIDPNKNIRNISLNQDIGNWNVQGNTDLENYGLGVNYNQEGGPFFAGASMDNMGNKNFNVGAKWEWGQPEQTYSTQALLKENPDLVYGLKYGGLVGLL